jgi:hypothetical protein
LRKIKLVGLNGGLGYGYKIGSGSKLAGTSTVGKLLRFPAGETVRTLEQHFLKAVGKTAKKMARETAAD